MPYFNYRIESIAAAEATFWQRRAFARAWAAIYRDDDRWTPPDYRQVRRALDPRATPHLARLDAHLLRVDALHRTGVSRSRAGQQEIPLTSIFERTLAAAVVIVDPRRRGRTAHLGLLHLHPDDEAFERLYNHVTERLALDGYRRVVGPVGLSPHLGSGALIDSWDAWPPRHTPGNPPYLPELLERRLHPLQDARLYRVAVPPVPPLVPPGRAAIRPFDPARLATDLRPLLVAATENPVAGFPPPDEIEAAFILSQLGLGSPAAYLAEIDYTPVGFVLAQRDTTGSYWRLGRRWALGRRPASSTARAGRVIFGAVLPEWRGQGIGRQLWQRTLRDARERGWETLTLGPIWQPREGPSPVAELLGPAAEARQTYRLYERSF